LGDIAFEARVRLFGGVRRRPVLFDLVNVERQPANLDAVASEERQALFVVPGHVEPVGVVVAKMEDDGPEPFRHQPRITSAGLILLRLRIVSPTREVRHPQLGAHVLDDAQQRVLLDPYLGAPNLIAPEVFLVGRRGGLDDVRRVVPS